MSSSTGKLVLAAALAVPLAFVAYRTAKRAGDAKGAAKDTDTKDKKVEATVARSVGSSVAVNVPAPSASTVAAQPADRWYFGYGSNMSTRTMNRRNIQPAQSEPAILKGWRLAMNLKSGLAPLEPTFANLERAAGEEVHGVVHRVTQAQIEQLTREEGGGRSYLREELPVVFYHKHPDTGLEQTVVASMFIIPDSRPEAKTDDGKDVACSKRYKGLLVHGAKESGLAPHYIAKLEALPEASLPDLKAVLTDDVKQKIAAREVTLDEIKDKSAHVWTSIKGVVVDLTENKTFVATIYGGNEKTYDSARFVCDPDCPNPTKPEELTRNHKEYINAALAFFLSTHPVVGHCKGVNFDF